MAKSFGNKTSNQTKFGCNMRGRTLSSCSYAADKGPSWPAKSPVLKKCSITAARAPPETGPRALKLFELDQSEGNGTTGVSLLALFFVVSPVSAGSIDFVRSFSCRGVIKMKGMYDLPVID